MPTPSTALAETIIGSGLVPKVCGCSINIEPASASSLSTSIFACLAITRIWPMALRTVRPGWLTETENWVPTKGLPFFWKLSSQVAAKTGPRLRAAGRRRYNEISWVTSLIGDGQLQGCRPLEADVRGADAVPQHHCAADYVSGPPARQSGGFLYRLARPTTPPGGGCLLYTAPWFRDFCGQQAPACMGVLAQMRYRGAQTG